MCGHLFFFSTHPRPEGKVNQQTRAACLRTLEFSQRRVHEMTVDSFLSECMRTSDYGLYISLNGSICVFSQTPKYQ